MEREAYIDEWASQSSLDWNEYGPGLYLVFKENPGYWENEMRDRGWQPGVVEGWYRWLKDASDEFVDIEETDLTYAIGDRTITLFPGDDNSEDLWVEDLTEEIRPVQIRAAAIERTFNDWWRVLMSAYTRIAREDPEGYRKWLQETYELHPDVAKYDPKLNYLDHYSRYTYPEYGQLIEPYPEILIEDFGDVNYGQKTARSFDEVRKAVLELQNKYGLYDDFPGLDMFIEYATWQDCIQALVDENGGTIDFNRW